MFEEFILSDWKKQNGKAKEERKPEKEQQTACWRGVDKEQGTRIEGGW